MKDYGQFEILGRTRDDAAGEAFDKVARAIGLGYPGGPKIDKLAKEGNPDAIEFPRAKIGENPYDFSFSGVKSAVLNYLNGAKMKGEEVNRADIAASFQKAVVDVLVEHTMQAAADFGHEKGCHCRRGCFQWCTSFCNGKGMRRKGIYVLSSITDFLYRQCCDDRGSCIL